jgi:hypothetical protein
MGFQFNLWCDLVTLLNCKLCVGLFGINKFNIYGYVNRKNIPIYIQQDAALQSLFYLETALHISGGTTTDHQERKHCIYSFWLVFVTPLLLSAAIVEELEPV